MTNLVSKISDKKMVKDFGITEAFFIDGEFYLTSNYEISYETMNNLENELSKFKS